MDRPTVQVEQLPIVEDILKGGQFTMTGLAKLSEAVLGTSTVVDGFPLAPTSPASLSAVLGAGSIYEQENLEQTSWSTLPADTHTIVKQGIQLDPVPITFSPPVTVGYSQIFLIEAQYQDVDVGPVVREYFNADDPVDPLVGPGNDGAPDFTARAGRVAVQAKAGIASSGTPAAPAPDAGWAPLWYVTLSAGQTTITSGNITIAVNAPFIDPKLPAVPASAQTGKWFYGGLTAGTSSAFQASLVPVPGALTTGMEIRCKMHTAPAANATLNANGLGAVAILRVASLALAGGEWNTNDFVNFIWTGAAWQIAGITINDVSVNFSTSITNYFTVAGSALNLNPLVMVAEMIRAPGVAAPALPSNVWTTWPINTLDINQITGASINLSTGHITLPAGRYRLIWGANVNNGGQHRSRIYDNTNAIELGHGLSCDSFTNAAGGGTATTNTSGGTIWFALTGTIDLTLDHINRKADSDPQAFRGDNSAGETDNMYDAFIRIEKEHGI